MWSEGGGTLVGEEIARDSSSSSDDFSPTKDKWIR